MVKSDGYAPDSRAGDRIDIVEREEAIERRLGRNVDQTVGFEFGMGRQGISHGRFDIGVADGKNAQNEMSASFSRYLGPDPVKGMVVMGSQIGFRLAVGEDPETSGRRAAGKEKCADNQGQCCSG